MGFLDRVTEKHAELEALNSAKNSSNISTDNTEQNVINSNLSFFAFAKKYGLNCCCSFSKKESYYYITDSIGFDGESILKSYSTDDFWNGSALSVDSITTFNDADNSLSTYKQFFSDNLLLDLETLSILKTSEDNILFICNIDSAADTSAIITDYKSVSSNITVEYTEKEAYDNFIINFDEALDSYIYTKGIKLNGEAFKESLFNEIFNSLCIFFAADSVKKNENPFELTINIPSEFSIKEELLFRHLVLNLSFILEDSAQLISIYKE